jgi:lipopolysaccharide export system permease protein
MKLLQRYYLREYLKLFTIVAFGLSLIFSLMDLINRIGAFIPHEPSMFDLFLYPALNLPQYFLYLMPVAALMSGLFVFGQAGKRRETIAIRAAGGGIKALLMPFVYAGLLFSIAAFLVGEFAVPDLSRRAHILRDILAKKEDFLSFKEGAVWLRRKDAIIRIDLLPPGKAIMKGVSIMRIENDMLAERIEAESAEWRPALRPMTAGSAMTTETGGNGAWYLKNVTSYDIKTGVVTKSSELRWNFFNSPHIFLEDMQKPEEMNVRELMAYTKRLRKAGFRNTKLVVDVQSRISYPLINVIMLVLGIALATRGVVGGGLFTAAVGIFISLLYWVMYTLCLSMGYTGIFPPVLAAWLVPALFGIMAFYLFRTIPE